MVSDGDFVSATNFIGGRWVESDSRNDAVSPAYGNGIGSVCQGRREDVDAAVSAAGDAHHQWSALSVFERSAALTRLAGAVESRRDHLARLLSVEQGKPLYGEAYGEVDSLIEYLVEAGETAKRLSGYTLQSRDPNKRVFIQRVPRGVIGAIQPWNFPLESIGIQVAPALAAGNTVVCVPAPTSSLIAYAFAQCVEAADLIPGIFNLVMGPGAVVGDHLAGHPGVSAVVFTGSTLTGMLVAERAAGKPQLLELGGNGPLVVLDDADLDLAVLAAVQSSFRCAGQTCTAAGRILIQDGVYDSFASRLSDAVDSCIVLGPSLDSRTTMGPLNNEKVAAKMDRHVSDAIERGATVLTGGIRSVEMPTSLYWTPTVLADVTETMAVSREETFGPIAPLQRISNEADALQAMKSSEYGLASAVFTQDLARGLKFAEAATTGTVVINDATSYAERHFPFGGAPGKASGVGRAHGSVAMEQFYTDLKTIVAHFS